MLKRPTKGSDDPDERQTFGLHPGDLGVVVIAAIFTLACIMIMVLPSPFARLEKAQAEQARKERQQAIDKAVATGEVSVGIAPSKGR